MLVMCRAFAGYWNVLNLHGIMEYRFGLGRAVFEVGKPFELPRLRCHPEVTSDQTKSNAHGVFPDQNYRVWDLV